MSQVTLEMSGDEQRLWRSMQRVIAKQNEMEGGFKRTGDSARRAGRTAEQSFGGQALAGLKSYAAGMLTASAAVGTLRAALQHMQQEQLAALASMRQLSDETMALNQVAQSPQDLARMQAWADQMATTSPISREAALQLAFDARSMGFEQDRELIARYAQVIQPASATAVVGKAAELFDKRVTGEQALNMVAVAAQASPLNADQLAKVVPTAAEGAAAAGSDLAETLGVLGVMANQFGEESTVAQRIKAFASHVSLSDLDGQGIVGAVQSIMAMSEEDRRAFLGSSQEVNAAYENLVKMLPQIMQHIERVQLAEKRGAGPGSAIDDAFQRTLTNPKMRAERELIMSQNLREIEREDRLALEGAQIEVAKNITMAKSDADRRSGFAKWFAETMMDAADFFGASPEAVRTVGRLAGTVHHLNPMRIGMEMGGHLRELGEPMESTTDDFGGEGAAGAMERAAAAQERAAHKLEHAADRMSSGSGSGGGGPLGAFPNQDE